MKVRTFFSLAAAVGLWAPTGLSAQQPAALPVSVVSSNQQLADSIAVKLRLSNAAAGGDVSISTQDGTVTLTGTVRSVEQKSQVIEQVRTVPGVVLVRESLTVITPNLLQVQGPIPAPVAPMPLAPQGGPPAGNGERLIEPAPLGIPGQISPDLQPPPLPPYAWPTYAPHNNLSRVAYPQAYPYNAFPFIGPYYPFPKVPLGWRKVTLEWEDGHWYLGRNSAPHDYWRVRFW